jgi:hypothetical protein
MSLPHILTLSEVADFLGVGTPAVAGWAQDGELPVCARSESGELLFYRWRVERDGPKLAAGELVRIVKTRRGRRSLLHDGHQLTCGCVLRSEGDAAAAAAWLCPMARMLQFVEQLVTMLSAAAPDDPLFGRLACVAADALADHLAPREVRLSDPDSSTPRDTPAPAGSSGGGQRRKEAA